MGAAEGLGAVPRRLIWDNETGHRAPEQLRAPASRRSPGSLATRIVQLKPYDPESKGIVERANQFLETSFLPGRTFASPEDFNAQLSAVAAQGQRPAGPAHRRPSRDLIGRRQGGDAGAAAGAARDRIRRAGSGCRGTTTSGSGSNDYSVHPQAIGRFVEVTADLDTVRDQPGRQQRRGPTAGPGAAA